MSTGIAGSILRQVRYLRMLSNSLVAAALATCYVLVLVLQLNPPLPLNPLRLVPLAQSFGVVYLVHLTAIFYVMLVARQLLARELFSPAWISIGVLSWFGAAVSAAGAVLMWANLRTFMLVLQPQIISAMTWGALALVASSVLFLLVALGRRHSDGRLRALWALCLIIVAAGSVGAPMALRGRGTLPPLEARPLDAVVDAPLPERTAHVTILAIDGGSLDLIAHATAEGRLPNFGRIFDSGAVMRLATVHPTSAEAVWTAVATGKLPQKNGIRSAAIYRPAGGGDAIRLLPDYSFASGLMRFGVLTEEPLTSAAIRVRPLWSILTLLGIRVGVVNWSLTYPAPVVRGYIVSDLYLRLAPTLSGLDDPSILYPPELAADVAPVVQASSANGHGVFPVSTTTIVPERHQLPGRTDRMYDRLAQSLARTHPTQVSIVRYQSLDPIGHYFLRYAVPQEFGDVTDEERRRYGQVLESHYSFIDDAIGRAFEALGTEDLLVVVSGYGMEPLGFGKRVLEQVIGDPEVSGTHEGAPDGFLMAYGAPVAKARLLRRASIVDVVPTVLYFLGLPIGRDMDGYARTDLFLPAFTEERPITFIPTYER
jgi:predicted AlkP superfamily phosphohydrolase/phosphomutase